MTEIFLKNVFLIKTYIIFGYKKRVKKNENTFKIIIV